jgi:hypothetical protein
VNKIKFQFKKKLTRKEVDHMEALKRAQVFIDTVQDKKNDADKVKKEDIMGDLKMRPPTPVWG